MDISVWGKFSCFISLVNFHFYFLCSLFFFETPIDLTLLPPSTLLIVWHFLSCLPSFCPFIQPFKNDFLNLIAYFSCHIFSFELFFLFVLQLFCLHSFLFLFNGHNISYLSRDIKYILYVFILFPAKSLMSPSPFLYSLVYFDLSDVKDVFSCVVILGCP